MAKMRQYNSRSAKITAAQARSIYERWAEGETQGALAREFGLSVVQVGRITRGESRGKETGASTANQRPNEIQITQADIDESLAKLAIKMGQQPPRVDAVAEFRAAAAAKRKAPSLYNDPPPSVPGEAEGSGLDRLQREIAQADPLAGLMDDSDKPTGD